MKLIADHAALADAVAWAAHALPNRPQIPVLAGLLLEAGNGRLTVSAFDYYTSRRAEVSADVFHPGRVLLPGRVLADVVKALPKQPVALDTNDTEAVLTCGSAEFGLRTLDAEDFPTLPVPPEAAGTVDAATLADAVAHIAPAAGRDDVVPMLTGICLDNTGGPLALAATDRYRIAAHTLPWQPTLPDATVNALVPGRILADLAKSLGGGEVTLRLGDGLAAVEAAGRTTTVRLLDEQFIDYRSRLTGDWPIQAEVEAAPLAAAVKRVALVAERNTAVRLTFSRGQVLVQAGGADTGRGRETVAATLTGADIEIAFQSQFLLDGLAGISGGQVRIGMTGAAKPALLAGPGENPAYQYLVMALRLA
ncbi:DNA polymerase III subunit beta [Streptosporangium violaceochromogenes]|nr:DNA polymerase III subunit beta [Streptosporangium violaceochromogenes]